MSRAMNCSLAAFIALFSVGPAAAQTEALTYTGLCEASAAAYVDDSHFLVASDETNRLQLYERGKPDPIGDGPDMEAHTSFDKSDIEAAAASGGRVYWMSSHSFNSSQEDKAKRKVFFATQVSLVGGVLEVTAIGRPVTTLRDALAAAVGATPGELNIEALAAGEADSLLIGLRAPLSNGRAVVVPFVNPADVVDNGSAPIFGGAISLDLGGRGLRSMELVGDGDRRYLLVAGPVSDAKDFGLYWWSGQASAAPVAVTGSGFDDRRPEAAIAVPGTRILQVLSDDGDVCSDDGPEDSRAFRSVDIDLR